MSVARRDPDAVVIGSGPNGLVAACVLAGAGMDVLVVEAHPQRAGGAVGSEAVTLPGYVHDIGAAFFPWGALSPAFRALPLERMVRWLSEAPARLAGLQHRKGAIAAGRDADLVVWDPDAETVVDPASLHHRHPVTPYAGLRLRGVVRTTMLRGEVIFHDGRFTGSPQGRQLLATRSG